MDRTEFIHISDVHFQNRYSTVAGRLIARTGVDFTEQFICGMAYIRKRYPHIDFFLLSGDLVHEGTEEEYRDFQRMWHETAGDIPLYAVPGNHDSDVYGAVFARQGSGGGGCGDNDNDSGSDNGIDNGSDNGSGINLPPYDREYSHASGIRILAMDSRGGKYESGLLTERQLKWLAKKLPPGSGDNTILLLHYTPHISGEEDFLTWQMENPVELYEVVKDSGLLAVFCGHTHKAYATRFGDIPCYTAGSITHSIDCGMDSMTLGNRTGFHHCVCENGRLDVEYVDIIPERPTEVTIGYEEFSDVREGSL